jgi:GTP pyrophosphokinase
MPEDQRTLNVAAKKGTLCAEIGFHCQKEMASSLAIPPGDLDITISDLRLRLEQLERWADRGAEVHRDTLRALARETLEQYVPLADRMGIQLLRKRLEDASFRILEPLLYDELARKVAPLRAEDEMCLVVLQAGVRRLLDENGIVATVQGRTKGLYSLYRKMCRLNCPLASVMDRIGLRVIVQSIAECYQVLGLLHTRFRPVAGTFDDYIARPKANGYRSLQICFYPVPDLSYKPVEFQIRTVQMHREAQYGPAAHWRYKSAVETGAEAEARLKWLRSLLEEPEPALDHAAFMERLCRQMLGDQLVMLGKDR